MDRCPSQRLMEVDMAVTILVLSEVGWVVTLMALLRRRMCLLEELDMVDIKVCQRLLSTSSSWVLTIRDSSHGK
jgi:hypothetical protein